MSKNQHGHQIMHPAVNLVPCQRVKYTAGNRAKLGKIGLDLLSIVSLLPSPLLSHLVLTMFSWWA
jgi:hypothetical protein